MTNRFKTLALSCLALFAIGCGNSDSGVGDALSGVQFNPPAPGDPCAIAQQNATGKWVTVVNAADAPPGAETLRYFSFNQPSVNRLGTVVFRGRARGSTGGEQAQSEGGGPLTGVWFRSLCSSEGILTKMVDRNTLVPAPNSNGVNFRETPSIPRIDADFDFMATRGNHQPVETVTLPDTTTTNPASESWAGIYATFVPTFAALPPAAPPTP